MKIALITDSHWGVRNDEMAFIENNKTFLDNMFFPYLKENDIDTMIHLGDLVDRRKYTNNYTMNRLREDFTDQLYKKGIKSHFIVGNHDTYYKNTNNVNSLRELLMNKYDNFFKIYDTLPEDIKFDGLQMMFIPWICSENRDETFKRINTTKSQIALGHLEIAGFEMYKGSLVSHGDDRSLFSRFESVYSGHFHHRSTDGQIFYLGSHAEFTWSDFDDPRGFHIFDTETRTVKFIENPYKMFKKLFYDDTAEDFDLANIDLSEYEKKFVKVIIKEKSNSFYYDKFIELLEKTGPVDIQVVEDHLNLDVENDQDIINEAESTLEIFKKYIENFKTKNIDKVKLEKTIVEIYNEALTVG